MTSFPVFIDFIFNLWWPVVGTALQLVVFAHWFEQSKVTTFLILAVTVAR